MSSYEPNPIRYVAAIRRGNKPVPGCLTHALIPGIGRTVPHVQVRVREQNVGAR